MERFIQTVPHETILIASAAKIGGCSTPYCISPGHDWKLLEHELVDSALHWLPSTGPVPKIVAKIVSPKITHIRLDCQRGVLVMLCRTFASYHRTDPE